jgi:protein gp37
MAGPTAIEWTEATWNPVTGCDRVSPGCAHCYALTLAVRLKAMGSVRYQVDGNLKTSGPGFGVTLHDDLVDLPLRWKKPRLIFVNSMSDLFHPEVPDLFVKAVFQTMCEATWHTFQVLTKRHDRLTALAQELKWTPNIWQGVSVENRRWLIRAEALKAVPAHVKFLSAEPLLGPLDNLDLRGIDWVIAGGESGPRHRVVQAAWLRDLRDRCVEAEVPFFFKQWGGRTPKAGGRSLDGRQWSEMPSVSLRQIQNRVVVQAPRSSRILVA